MKKAIRRIVKRIFIFILVVFLIYLLISNIDLIRDLAGGEKISVLIDADAANGVDDILSILRIMEAEELELKGLLSAQWRLADLENDSSVRSNQKINRLVLEHFSMIHILHSEGAALPLVFTPDSEIPENDASLAIIRSVQDLPYGQKLNMLCLGSATNLATAILIKPEIADKIICYIQGPQYNPARRSWNKNDLVTRLDLEAMDVILNEEKLEIHLLPANVASEMYLLKSALKREMPKKDILSQLIAERFLADNSKLDSIACGSLALVQAFLYADLSTQKQLIAPPENTQRKIYVFTRIDQPRMAKDWWNMIDDYGE